MPQYIKDREGGLHEFDDNASDAEIRQHMQDYWARRSIAPMPAPTPPPGTVTGGFTPNPSAPPASIPPLSDDAERAKRIMLLGGLRNSRAMESAGHNSLTTDPSYIYQQTETKRLADQAGQRSSMQDAGTAILPGVRQLREMIQKTPEPVWAAASGPYNAQVQPARTERPLSWGAINAPDMTPTQARAAYGFFGSPDPAYVAANDFRIEREHLIGALTEQMIASAPKGTAAGGSDARMELFKDLMSQLKGASTREHALRIMNTAEDTIRNVFRLPVQLRQDSDYYKLQIPPHADYIDFITPEGEVKRKYRARPQPVPAQGSP